MRGCGRFVSFVDSDDFWFPDKLQKVLKSFGDETRYAFHQHNLYLFRGNTLTNISFRESLVSGDYGGYADNLRKIPDFIPTSGLTFRMDVLRKVYPIPSDFKTCADGYLTRTSLAYGEVSAANFFGGAYRDHHNNATFGNSRHNPSHYLHNILLPNLFNYYEKKQIPWRFGYATNSEYRENISKICLEQNSEILIFRSASIELVHKLLAALQFKIPTARMNLLVQTNSLEKFTDLGVRTLEIEDGPFSEKSIQPVIQQEISEQNYKLIIIPLSTWEIFTYHNVIRLANSFKAESTLLIYPNGFAQKISNINKENDQISH